MTTKPSPRQVETLRMVMEEGSALRAAERMGVSYQTVKNHLNDLYKRLTATEGRVVNSGYAAAYVLWLRDLWDGHMPAAPVVHLTIDGVECEVTPIHRPLLTGLE